MSCPSIFQTCCTVIKGPIGSPFEPSEVLHHNFIHDDVVNVFTIRAEFCMYLSEVQAKQGINVHLDVLSESRLLRTLPALHVIDFTGIPLIGTAFTDISFKITAFT